tara:strand:- start:15289 stop:15558 length:270 start_codon:yes stop_codon:yes gene_type:complete
MILIIGVLTVNLLISFIVGKSGQKRELGFTQSFLLSFFFSPIIGLLFVIASKEITKEEQENSDKDYSGLILFILLLITSVLMYILSKFI